MISRNTKGMSQVCVRRQRDAELALGGPRGMGMGTTGEGASPALKEKTILRQRTMSHTTHP